MYSFFLKFFKKKIENEKFFISDSYLGLFDEIKLNLKLSCFPKYGNFTLPENKTINNEDRIKYILKNFTPKNEFEKIWLEKVRKKIDCVAICPCFSI